MTSVHPSPDLGHGIGRGLPKGYLLLYFLAEIQKIKDKQSSLPHLEEKYRISENNRLSCALKTFDLIQKKLVTF